MTTYRLSSTSMFYAPGMIQWMLALTKRDVKGARSDAGARRHFIEVTWPTLPPRAVKAILEGRYSVDGEDVIVTA